MLPVIFNTNTGSSLPAMPEAMLAQFKGQMDSQFSAFGGGSFRRIHARKMDFELIGDGGTTIVPANEMVGVMICAAPNEHCVWYSRSYTPGQEPEAKVPDLVWVRKSESDFPEALPERYRQKVLINGAQRWAFQILRRTIWVLGKTDGNGQMSLDTDKPYILDLSSMSIYGKSMPEQNLYKLSGLVTLCKRFSNSSFVMLPSMFMTQIVIDPNVSVTGPLMFRPNVAPNGMPMCFDMNTIQTLYELSVSEEVKDLLRIQERLDYTDKSAGKATGAQVGQKAEQVMQQPTQVAQPTQISRPVQLDVPSQPAQPVASAQSTLLAQAQSILSGAMGAAPAAPVQPAAKPTAATSEAVDALIASLS